MVYEPRVQRPDWRDPAVRCSLHRALLHPHVHVASPVLLPLWLPLPGVCHLGHHMCRDHHSAVLLPALQ